ncbi:LysR family transcriptional regulator [Ferrimonas senticii]|uniref:LysR family transcriptional regulator n=1 Tax=Ferrimonas senticii TaxID=394566 RepID=UPI0003F8D41D|nr:LysR family transcriptional regulator [Ferrimonas senticii]
MTPRYRANSTVEQWRILQAVVDFGGYAQAASALNKSQSSLNHAVAKLQTVLGVQLLELQGRKAVLTQAGLVLLRRSRSLTAQIEQLETLASNLEQGWEPEIHLSREILYPTTALYQALTQFYPESRGSRVVITDNVLSGSSEAVNNRQFDLVITGRIPAGHHGTPLGTVALILVCGANHPLAALEFIDESRLAQELQIVIRDTGSQANKELGWLKAEQRWTLSNFHEALAILKQNVGFCWVPEAMAAQAINDGELVHLRNSNVGGAVVPMSLVIPRPEQLGPAANRFAELIVANCLGLSSPTNF